MHIDPDTHIHLATDLAVAVIAARGSTTTVLVGELPTLMKDCYRAVASAAEPEQPAEPPKATAVDIRKSIHPDYLVSFEDGRRYKSLKRHLHTNGLTPEQYRAKWGLSPDYPMVAANYSAVRSQLAKNSGLGKKKGGA